MFNILTQNCQRHKLIVTLARCIITDALFFITGVIHRNGYKIGHRSECGVCGNWPFCRWMSLSSGIHLYLVNSIKRIFLYQLNMVEMME